MAGRKPKPTAVKKLEGNPGKRKLNKKEPIPAKGMPECPDWLLPEAKKEWERLADLMNQMGVLTEVDMAAFAAYCQSYIKVTKAKSKEKIDGIVAAIMALDRCIRQEGQSGSVYDERGLLMI